jgi:hypothetical protein
LTCRLCAKPSLATLCRNCRDEVSRKVMAAVRDATTIRKRHDLPPPA